MIDLAVSDFDRVLWLGDLNFRAVDTGAIDRFMIAASNVQQANEKHKLILAQDQLKHEMNMGM
jgi:hypothetical protein